MAYEKQTWVDNETPVDAEHLNHMEDGIAGLGVYYGTSSTAASVTTKVVSCADVTELYEGLAIMVSFANNSTATAVEMNVNSLGSKAIYINGAKASSTNYFFWAAGSNIVFVYDGSCWIPVANAGSYFGACSTAAATAGKSADIADFILRQGTIVTIAMDKANTASSPTLTVSSTGARTIKGNTAWAAGDYVTFVFDGENYVSF